MSDVTYNASGITAGAARPSPPDGLYPPPPPIKINPRQKPQKVGGASPRRGGRV
jgi:hypothetical protein